jgi:hypothetical protein
MCKGGYGDMPMAGHSDLLVFDQNDSPIAAIEVKNRPDLGSRDAALVRRNLIAHRLVAPVDYFLLVSQDIGYLWGPEKRAASDAPPDLSFPMSPVLKRYAIEPTALGRLYGSQLELLVSSWIQELANANNPAEEEPELSLERSGFSSAVRRGRVVAQGQP